jgi:hypothetical protein
MGLLGWCGVLCRRINWERATTPGMASEGAERRWRIRKGLPLGRRPRTCQISGGTPALPLVSTTKAAITEVDRANV